MPTITTAAGQCLHYRTYGLPGGCPILLLHGVQGCSDLWATVAQGLAARGFYVVAPDLRGHGRSGWAPDYRLSTHIQDAVDLLAALEFSQVDIVGHSLGGSIAWGLAVQWPPYVRRLVIEDQHPDSQPGVVHAFETWAAEWPWRLASREEGLAYLQAHRRSLDWWGPSLVEHAQGGWGWAFDPVGVVESVRDLALRSHWQAISQVRVPTLLVRGTASEHLSPDVAARMVEAIPDCRLITLPGDHWVHRDSEPYLAAVASFLLSG